MIAAAAAVWAATGPDADADTWKLVVPGKVEGIRFGDVDGDRDADAVITFHRDDGPRLVREVALFLRGDRGFAASPTARLEVDDSVLFADLADLDRDGVDAVLLIDTAGVRRVPFTDGSFGPAERVATVDSAFRATSTTSFPFVDIAKDLDRDGRDDLFLPARGGYAFLRALSGGGFDASRLIGGAPEHGVRWGRNAQFRLTTTMPRPSPTDWNGDGVGDLMLAYDGQLVLVELGREGPPAAPRVVLDLAALLDADAAPRDALAKSDGILRDVDGDGRADLILTRRTAKPGLLMGVTTRTLLLLSADLSADAPRPRQAIRTDGVTSPPRLFDLDRDGALDLIVTTVPTDLLTRMREAVFEAANVTFFVYRFDPSRGRFESEPVFSDVLAVPADRLLDVGAYGWVTFSADYDGDGRPDYATYHAPSRTLSIRKGEAERGLFSSRPITFAERPFASFAVDLPGPFSGLDVDGDGRAEIVSHGADHALIVEVDR